MMENISSYHRNLFGIIILSICGGFLSYFFLTWNVNWRQTPFQLLCGCFLCRFVAPSSAHGSKQQPEDQLGSALANSGFYKRLSSRKAKDGELIKQTIWAYFRPILLFNGLSLSSGMCISRDPPLEDRRSLEHNVYPLLMLSKCLY